MTPEKLKALAIEAVQRCHARGLAPESMDIEGFSDFEAPKEKRSRRWWGRRKSKRSDLPREPETYIEVMLSEIAAGERRDGHGDYASFLEWEIATDGDRAIRIGVDSSYSGPKKVHRLSDAYARAVGWSIISRRTECKEFKHTGGYSEQHLEIWLVADGSLVSVSRHTEFDPRSGNRLQRGSVPSPASPYDLESFDFHIRELRDESAALVEVSYDPDRWETWSKRRTERFGTVAAALGQLPRRST